jgi:hypothetical protein
MAKVIVWLVATVLVVLALLAYPTSRGADLSCPEPGPTATVMVHAPGTTMVPDDGQERDDCGHDER